LSLLLLAAPDSHCLFFSIRFSLSVTAKAIAIAIHKPSRRLGPDKHDETPALWVCQGALCDPLDGKRVAQVQGLHLRGARTLSREKETMSKHLLFDRPKRHFTHQRLCKLPTDDKHCNSRAAALCCKWANKSKLRQSPFQRRAGDPIRSCKMKCCPQRDSVMEMPNQS